MHNINIDKLKLIRIENRIANIIFIIIISDRITKYPLVKEEQLISWINKVEHWLFPSNSRSVAKSTATGALTGAIRGGIAGVEGGPVGIAAGAIVGGTLGAAGGSVTGAVRWGIGHYIWGGGR